MLKRSAVGAWTVAAAAVCWPGCGIGSVGGIDFRDSGYSIPAWECTSADTWVIRGLEYEHFAAAVPGELLAATLRRGDVVALRVTTLRSTGCDGSVAQVQWRSTSPDVGTISAGGTRDAELRALNPGETRVLADLTLADGSRVTAELHAVPSPGNPVLRVYVVRVVR